MRLTIHELAGLLDHWNAEVDLVVNCEAAAGELETGGFGLPMRWRSWGRRIGDSNVARCLLNVDMGALVGATT